MQERLIRVAEVMKRTGLAKSTIWLYAKEHENFPKPLKLSPRVTVWRESDIDNYITNILN